MQNWKFINEVVDAAKLPFVVEWSSPTHGILRTKIIRVENEKHYHDGHFTKVNGDDVTAEIMKVPFSTFTLKHPRFRLPGAEVIGTKGMGVDIKQRGPEKCSCDFVKTILVTGCTCGGY